MLASVPVATVLRIGQKMFCRRSCWSVFVALRFFSSWSCASASVLRTIGNGLFVFSVGQCFWPCVPSGCCAVPVPSRFRVKEWFVGALVGQCVLTLRSFRVLSFASASRFRLKNGLLVLLLASVFDIAFLHGVVLCQCLSVHVKEWFVGALVGQCF